MLPNVWDAGSAKVVAEAGFSALATTSAGIAFSLGRPDGGVTRDVMLARVAAITAAVPELPVTADLESGYGGALTDVEVTVAGAIAAGAVGGNLEDSDPSSGGALFPIEQAAERIAAGRAAADQQGLPFTLNARVDSFLREPDGALDDAVARAARYRDAGADCIFVPGVSDAETTAALIDGIDGPLNLVMGLRGEPLSVAELTALGVRRITVGGSLARATLGLVRRAALGLQDGQFDFTSGAIPHGELNALFGE